MGCLRREYEEYLRRERGLSERTIEHCWGFAARFLKFRFGDKMGDLSQITAIDIVGFMQQLVSRKKPFRDKTPPTHLRNFFRYLFSRGKTTANLALCVPWIKQQSDTRVPRHLDAAQVETILRAIRVDSPIGRRNYAMMLLPARLGLRAPEVISMQIDDVDWRAGEIIVRGKGLRQDRLPLPQDVGEALAKYLQRDRVSSSRALFVVSRAPHRPFRDGAMLNVILKKAFAQTGLTPPASFVGSHVLRHSLAVTLARNGASLDEIGDLLRHQYRASTMIYARLDIEGLRSIAQRWPVAGGAR
ncbi:MAG: site-specific integrase [Acidobacteriia bacterium]|nr:site-specific integrase [Terriglobia bacterium]